MSQVKDSLAKGPAVVRKHRKRTDDEGIAPSMPVLDTSMTILFLFLIGFTIFVSINNNCVGLLAKCTVLAAVSAAAIDWVLKNGGWKLSVWLHSNGYATGPKHPLAAPKQLGKFREQGLQFFAHIIFAAMEYYIIRTETWWDDLVQLYDPPNVQFRDMGQHRPALPIFYTTQLVVWILLGIVHRFYAERRKDYFVMYGHHIATIILISTSWWCGGMRTGVLVLWVHDVSDIFIDLLKLTNYLKLDGAKGFFLTELSYAGALFSWVYWRLIRYPFPVLYACLGVPYNMFGPGAFPSSWTSPLEVIAWVSKSVQMVEQFVPFWGISNVLLFTLLGLHVWWFYLLLRVGYRVIVKGPREASRDEYEGGSEEDEAATGHEGDAAGTGVESKSQCSDPSDSPRNRLAGSPASSGAEEPASSGGSAPSSSRSSAGGKKRA